MPLYNRPSLQFDAPLLRRNRLYGMRMPPILGEEDDLGIPEESLAPEPTAEPKKEGLLAKIGKLFGISRPEPEYDELGVEKPAPAKEGIGSKILNIALPAAVGLAGGVGVLPGAAAGFFGGKKRDQAAYDDAQDRYDTRRLYRMKALAPDKSSTQKDWEYYQGLPQEKRADFLNLKAAGSPYSYSAPPGGGEPGKVNINPHEPKSETSDERYIRLVNKMRQGGTKALSPGDKQWLLQEKGRRDKSADIY